MTETRDFFLRAEEELSRSALVSAAAYDELGRLSPDAFYLVRSAMEFVERNGGCENVAAQGYAPSDEERVAAVRLMLMKLKLHTAEPVWSSDVLRRAVDAAMSLPGGTLSDLLQAVFSIFADYPAELSQARANFVKDLVIECFTQHSSAYDAINWECFLKSLDEGATAAQLYRALLAVPPTRLPGPLAAVISVGLANTPYHDEARALTDRANEGDNHKDKP